MPVNGRILGELLDGIREEEPNIAWIRVTDQQGDLVIQSGDPVGEPIAFQRAAEGINRDGPAAEIRDTESGQVLVTARPVRRSSWIPPLASREFFPGRRR